MWVWVAGMALMVALALVSIVQLVRALHAD